MSRVGALALALLCLALTGTQAGAEGGYVQRLAEPLPAPPPPLLPRIAIIIDDLGNNPAADRRAVDLPGPIACSFLPVATAFQELARRAHASAKEVLLHQPMEAVGHLPLGPEALLSRMGEAEFRAVLNRNLAAVPYVVGLNNHMGSRLTANKRYMSWLMSELAGRQGFFFVDSRTVGATVAAGVASQFGVPQTRRDLFLDNEPTPKSVSRQFEALLKHARTTGTALAIGHPKPATLSLLELRLPELSREGIELVPVQTLIEQRQSILLATETKSAEF